MVPRRPAARFPCKRRISLFVPDIFLNAASLPKTENRPSIDITQDESKDVNHRASSSHVLPPSIGSNEVGDSLRDIDHRAINCQGRMSAL